MSRATGFTDDESTPVGAKGGGDDGGSGISARIPKLSIVRRVADFYHNVKLEMRRTTWPTRTEVWSTTLVVIIAVIFFGFYLSGIDYLIAQGFRYLEKVVK
jgi:preprotein translocase subunit SecE